MRDLFLELKNRKVIKVGIAYLVGAWLVLPFPDVSAEQDQEHFCDVLTGIPGLRVASRTSTFSLKGKQVDLDSLRGHPRYQAILDALSESSTT